MNCWYVAAWDHELIDGKLLARTILDQPVVLYKGDSGRAVALDDRCCHRGAKLSKGRLEGDDVRCMYHGLKFDPTGKCVQIPGQRRAKCRSRCSAFSVNLNSNWKIKFVYSRSVKRFPPPSSGTDDYAVTHQVASPFFPMRVQPFKLVPSENQGHRAFSLGLEGGGADKGSSKREQKKMEGDFHGKRIGFVGSYSTPPAEDWEAVGLLVPCVCLQVVVLGAGSGDPVSGPDPGVWTF